MIFVLLLCVGLAQSGTVQKRSTYDLENASDHFQTFIQQFNKQYEDESEMQMRFEIFKENLKIINKMNTSPNETGQFGINQFSDLTSEEFTSMYGCANIMDEEDSDVVKLNTALGIEVPGDVDWRAYFPPAKNQATCGSCWAFGTVGSIEGQYAMKHGAPASFSEQQLLDCSAATGCDVGQGLTLPGAAQYVISAGGLMSEQEYPYLGQKSQCRFQQGRAMVRVNSYQPVDITQNEQLAMELLSTGPFTIILSSDSLQNVPMDGSVFNSCEAGQLNHAVVLAGYGTANGVPYWLIRNSWGSGWGEGGYLKIARNGPACGLLNRAAVSHQVA